LDVQHKFNYTLIALLASSLNWIYYGSFHHNTTKSLHAKGISSFGYLYVVSSALVWVFINCIRLPIMGRPIYGH